MRWLINKIIAEIWNTADVPNSWKDVLLITIYKNNDDRAICFNSRGIALLGNAGKVLARILLKRLTASISEDITPETQCIFRAGRSTVDMISAAKQLMKKSREQHRDVYIALVNLSIVQCVRLYKLNRELLFVILERCGCLPRFIQLIRSLRDGIRLRVRYGDDLKIKTLVKFHMNSLDKILGITWKDKVPLIEVLKRTGCVFLENTLHHT